MSLAGHHSSWKLSSFFIFCLSSVRIQFKCVAIARTVHRMYGIRRLLSTAPQTLHENMFSWLFVLFCHLLCAFEYKINDATWRSPRRPPNRVKRKKNRSFVLRLCRMWETAQSNCSAYILLHYYYYVWMHFISCRLSRLVCFPMPPLIYQICAFRLIHTSRRIQRHTSVESDRTHKMSIMQRGTWLMHGFKWWTLINHQFYSHSICSVCFFISIAVHSFKNVFRLSTSILNREYFPFSSCVVDMSESAKYVLHLRFCFRRNIHHQWILLIVINVDFDMWVGNRRRIRVSDSWSLPVPHQSVRTVFAL